MKMHDPSYKMNSMYYSELHCRHWFIWPARIKIWWPILDKTCSLNKRKLYYKCRYKSKCCVYMVCGMIRLWKMYSMMPKYIICHFYRAQKGERTAQRYTCISAVLYKSCSHTYFTALLYQIQWFKWSFNAAVVDISVRTTVIRQTPYQRCSDVSAQTVNVGCGFFCSSVQDFSAIFKSCDWFGNLVLS
jgi:hypothetical protein